MGRSIARLDVDYLISPRWLVVLVAVALASIVLQQVVIFFAGMLLLLALSLSWLWGRYCLDGLEYRRDFAGKAVAFGAEVTMTVTIVNRKPLPLAWLEIDDEVPKAMTLVRGDLRASWKVQRAILPNVLSLRWYERVTRRYHFHCAERGEHRFGPAELRSGDLFGLARRKAELDGCDTVLVYPLVVPVEALDLPSRFPLGEERSTDRLYGDPLRMAGVRPYSLGDSVRQIHWKASARLGVLQVKTYDPSATRRAMLLLNLRTTPDSWYGSRSELLELAICAAASVATHLTAQGYQCGLAANGLLRHTRGGIRIAPSRAPRQLTVLLTALAGISPLMVGPYAHLLEAERRRVPAGATVVLITGVLDDQIVECARGYRAAGHPAVFVLLGESLRGTSTPPGLPSHWIGDETRWRRLRSFRLAGRAQVEDTPG